MVLRSLRYGRPARPIELAAIPLRGALHRDQRSIHRPYKEDRECNGALSMKFLPSHEVERLYPHPVDTRFEPPLSGRPFDEARFTRRVEPAGLRLRCTRTSGGVSIAGQCVVNQLQRAWRAHDCFAYVWQRGFCCCGFDGTPQCRGRRAETKVWTTSRTSAARAGAVTDYTMARSYSFSISKINR